MATNFVFKFYGTFKKCNDFCPSLLCHTYLIKYLPTLKKKCNDTYKPMVQSSTYTQWKYVHVFTHMCKSIHVSIRYPDGSFPNAHE
jgi:hypothetical protein